MSASQWRRLRSVSCSGCCSSSGVPARSRPSSVDDGMTQRRAAPKTGADWVAQLRNPNEATAHEARLFLGNVTPDDSWMMDDFLVGTETSDEYVRFWAATAAMRCAKPDDS